LLLSNGERKIAFVIGTRPEVIKLYPIIQLFDSCSLDYTLIHTGQHHDYNLFLKFIKEFGIRQPDYSIAFEHPHSTVDQFSEIMRGVGNILSQSFPSSVVVIGDTNSVSATALAATKLKIPVIHVEAGLRSYDWRMQEEYNRRMVDHISDVLFAPNLESAMMLEREQVQGKIYNVGNTVLDAVRLCFTSTNKIIRPEQEKINMFY
jgi:UDP-N-acetylglucosamine 2-epimerase (non-hydrolysing)